MLRVACFVLFFYDLSLAANLIHPLCRRIECTRLNVAAHISTWPTAQQSTSSFYSSCVNFPWGCCCCCVWVCPINSPTDSETEIFFLRLFCFSLFKFLSIIFFVSAGVAIPSGVHCHGGVVCRESRLNEIAMIIGRDSLLHNALRHGWSDWVCSSLDSWTH